MVQNPMRALALLTREKFAGVYVTAKFFREAFEIGKLLQNEQILEGMPDGVVLLEGDNTILWGNGRFRQWSGRESRAGGEFLHRPGQPRDPGPRFLPLPYRHGHRPEHQLHAAQPGQPLLPGPCRPDAGAERPAAAPDRHRPRRHPRGPPAAEDRRHPPGRHGAGRPRARGTHQHAGQGPHRAVEGQHRPLHQGPVELRGGRGPPAGPEDQPPGAAAGAGHDERGGRPRPLCPAAAQRRDRLRGGHRQKLSLRRHHRGPPLPRRRAGGQEHA